jgi:predicted metal-dependent hydrolase
MIAMAVSSPETAYLDRVVWGDTELPYTVNFRARRRTLSITVHPDLRIVVTAPEGTSSDAIRAKVLKRARWIRKARVEFEKFHPLQPPRSYVPGEAHRYLGRQCRLKAAKGVDSSVKLDRGQIIVTTPERPTPQVLRSLVEDWLESHAKRIFTERLAICHAEAARHGIPMPDLWIRTMAARWGSCTPTGRVILNIELIKAPVECIDYVITHELCHLIEPNHNARFWQLLSAIMPDWIERRGRLNALADI